MKKIEIEVPKEDFKDLDNLSQCECGNWAHHKYMRSGSDNTCCPNCVIAFQHEIITKIQNKIKELINDESKYIDTIKQIYADANGLDVEDLDSVYYFEDFKF